MRQAAEDVIHRKVLLADDMAMPNYEGFADGWLEYENSGQQMGPKAASQHYSNGAAMVDHMRRVLQASENFYVAKPMMELAASVAPDMPDEELLASDIPAMNGWMWYAVPYRQIDIRRQVLYDNAIMWSVIGSKVRVWHFTDRSTTGDSVNLSLRAEMTDEQWNALPYLNLNHIFDMQFGEELPRGISWDTPLPPDAKLEGGRVENPDGSVSLFWATDQPVDAMFEGDGEPRMIRSPLAAFIVCLWRLCQQSIATRYDEEPQRNARRRMTKAHLPVSPISIITLRRRDTKEHPDAHIEWQHRWIVRGHWRKQPYRELDSKGEKVTVYRNIYINPYLKGPEDKPLLHRDKVNVLVR